MIYELNNKKIKIPDDEIQKNMKILEITEEQAIQMYLEDERIPWKCWSWSTYKKSKRQ